jgi:hypothetical protein
MKDVRRQAQRRTSALFPSKTQPTTAARVEVSTHMAPPGPSSEPQPMKSEAMMRAEPPETKMAPPPVSRADTFWKSTRLMNSWPPSLPT